MYREIKIGLALIATLVGGLALADAYKAPAYNLQVIETTSRSWNGQELVYPTEVHGDAAITTAIIKIKKGQSLAWHIHEVPMLVYVLDGELTLEDDKGNKKVIHEDQTALESVGISHRGIATGKEDTELFAVYLGASRLKNTVVDAHKNK